MGKLVTREEQIVSTFVELSDAMVDDFDIVEFLHRVVRRTMELLGCAEVGLLLANTTGRLQVMASSSERSEALELLQSENEEGPCFESYRGSRLVFSEDLEQDRGRWPSFVPAALDRGISSVHAIPMRVRGETIGTLNLFGAEGGQLKGRDVPLGQGMADIAAVAILQERAVREARDVVEQLQHALNSRVLIEQAKGVLAERAHVSVDVAFACVHAYSRAHNRRLSDVARDVVEGRLDDRALMELSPPSRQ
jgi:GAF domain-containing protein